MTSTPTWGAPQRQRTPPRKHGTARTATHAQHRTHGTNGTARHGACGAVRAVPCVRCHACGAVRCTHAPHVRTFSSMLHCLCDFVCTDGAQTFPLCAGTSTHSLRTRMSTLLFTLVSNGPEMVEWCCILSLQIKISRQIGRKSMRGNIPNLFLSLGRALRNVSAPIRALSVSPSHYNSKKKSCDHQRIADRTISAITDLSDLAAITDLWTPRAGPSLAPWPIPSITKRCTPFSSP